MSIANAFIYASSIMTLISFLTFIGILGWAYMPSRKPYFDTAAHLPLVDEAGAAQAGEEMHHG